jgi:SAM-dependent methyltransferase
MSSYLGRHAELYDVFYADKPYNQEAAFVHNCITRYGTGTTRRLMELACGTGSHALELERHGYAIVATDYSEPMLVCARAKAARVSSSVEFIHQDMRVLNLGPPLFDAVLCLFDSIGYVLTNEAITQVFKGVHRHLRPEGLFIFEFWHAAAMLKSFDPVRVRSWVMPLGEVLRISETQIDYVHQVASVTYRIYELNHDGTFNAFSETQVNRFFLVQEMTGLLTACGFAPIKWFAGFCDDKNISDTTWHVVAIARRKS